MIQLSNQGVYLLRNEMVVEETDIEQLNGRLGEMPNKAEAKKGTMTYSILKAHNTVEDMEQLSLKYDSMTSHDITYVGIIQTARASGMKEFPLPMYSPTAITLFVQWVAPSTKMTTCLPCPQPKNMAVSMSPPTWQ